MNIHRNILLTAWVLFLICLALPSFTLKPGFFFNTNHATEFGFEAGFYSTLAIPSIFDSFREFQISILGLGNIIALLSPLLLFKLNKLVYVVCFLFMILAFVFAIKLSLAEEPRFVEQLHIGYYVWVVSFLALSVGIGSYVYKFIKSDF